MNKINEIRKEITLYFDADGLVADSQKTIHSPNNKFRLETSSYHQNKPDVNWNVSRVEVFDNFSNEVLFDFFAIDDADFHSWLCVDGKEYLLFPEDMFGGQTVFDLANRQMASYSENVDGFIATSFHLSPDGKLLATIGCVWAWPYEVRVYDFSEPMKLPLMEIMSLELLGGENTLTWLDNSSFKTEDFSAETLANMGMTDSDIAKRNKNASGRTFRVNRSGI